MRTSLDLCFCLLTLCGITPVLYGVKVVVEEGSDAVLPCSPSTKENLTGKIFFWRKDGQKEVFFYDKGFHSNNGLTGRVSHFKDQLMNGNASIKIQNTKIADSGIYSCDFRLLQPRQTFNIELVVGASPELYVTTLNKTKDWALLQCDVRGASPEPKVEWQDSSGKNLSAEEPQVSERGGRYYVTININVTKTGRYHCVVTQEELSHQIHSETSVQLNEDQSREVKRWRLATTVLGVLVVVLPLLVAVVCCISKSCRQKAKHVCSQIMKSCECLVKKFCKKRVKTEEGRQQSLPSQNCYVTVATTEMELDDGCRASENPADTEPTERVVQ